ncbi:MAG: hypothetical protein PHO83_10290 [Geobacteraceae bacterium]|nr:hypothetical protein [Geobacteraceae bacterium]
MLTGALRPTDVRFVSIIIMCCLLLGTAANAAVPKKKKSPVKGVSTASSGKVPTLASSSKGSAVVRDWGPYLDVAQQLTYWERSEIAEWRENREKELAETLAAYITVWNKKLSDPAAGVVTVRGEDQQPVYQEKDYLRLAIAQTVDYLQNDDRDSLEGAAQTLEKLKDKTAMPEIAYWTGFVKALQAMENNDSRQFVVQVYAVWNNAIMYLEQGALAGKEGDAGKMKSAPFHYRNLVNLVVNRAIIDQKLADLNALGPLFLMLRQRDLEEKETEGKYLTTLVERINEGFVAPDSDRYRLSFTVAAIEAKRLQQIAAAKLDAEGMTEEARKYFEDARSFNDYALKWAESRRSSGAVNAVIDYLDTTSFAIERLKGNESAPSYNFFVMLPTHDGQSTLLKSMAVYNDVATYTEGGWKRAGYADRESYLQATHRLWRAIMELSLWTGDFYMMQLVDTAEPQKIYTLVPPMQVVLNSYLDFLSSQRKRNLPDVIPDFAYFGAAEASEKLAYGYMKTYSYSTDVTAYNLWFLHRMQSTELFPLNPREMMLTASVLKRDGRYNLFLDYYLPLAERFRKSDAVRIWLEEGTLDDSSVAIREYRDSIAEIVVVAPEETATVAPVKKQPVYFSTFKKLREELQRKPDHPVHRLLKDFYLEEIQQATNYTALLHDSNRLNNGF